MMMTGQPGEGGQPPVNLRQEVISQLVKPITVTTRLEKPYTGPDSSSTLLAIGVGDDQILDTALARIHDAFIAKGNKEMRRELLNCTIYLLPSFSGFPFLNSFGMQPMMSPAEAGPSQYAFAVAGDQLVFGTVKAVEQAIRDLRRENIESINSDPMYQYASRYLPPQAGIYSYENEQITNERAWKMLKEAARQSSRQAEVSESDEDTGMFPVVTIGGSFLFEIVKQMKDMVDFTALPDFQMVKQYYGPTVGYVVGNEQGIYAEIISLNAPSNIP